MTTHISSPSPLFIARLAGLLYLLVVPLGIFGSLYVSSRLIVSGDAAATASNIMASESLFRFGSVSLILAPIVMLLVSLVLYQLLEPVNKGMAMLMVALVVIAVPIALMAEVNKFTALQLLSGADYLEVLAAEQSQALAYLFLRSRAGIMASLFWGLWLFPLGYLVFKSGFFPRILGILLMLACFGYAISSIATFLDYSVSIGLVAAVGEVLFILWLLIKGVNVEQWEKRAAAPA
jgi:hypothetical protein